jgi:threonylcarbamoyladenosine tRNA methylthiotransferase MtaB
MILKRMKRRHGRADAIAVCRAIRNARPDIVLGADLIAGFPTETDANFQRSLDLIGECGLTWLHVFPYSPRPGTPAARMPAVPKSLRRERAKRLRDAGAAAVEAFLDARIGRDADVLVESDGIGRTEHYAPIRADHGLTEGAIARLRVTGRSGGILTGRPAA